MAKAPTQRSIPASFLRDDDSESSSGPNDRDGTDVPARPVIDASAHVMTAVAVAAGGPRSRSSSDGSSAYFSSVVSDGVAASGRRSPSSSDSSSVYLASVVSDGYGDGDGDSDGDGRAPLAHAFNFVRQASQATVNASISSADGNDSRDGRDLTMHELAARVARGVAAAFAANLPRALVEDYEHRDVVAPFRADEIVLGPLLGSGEFSHVYEIKSFRPGGGEGGEENSSPPSSPEEAGARGHMKRRERYHDTGKACYAVKHLRPRLLEEYSRTEYAQSASDLANEAEFLASLQHPNIIKLRGIAAAGPKGFADGPHGYFLILDRLNDTLDKRIKQWKRQRRRRNRLASSMKSKLDAKKIAAMLMSNKEALGEEGGRDHHHDKKDKPLISEDQMDVGLQISSALMYLHEKSVMFRDLKPQNIGFDVRGDVKLFDFGLATVMPIFGDPYENKYDMSGAGSPRYMAPEVLIDPPQKYNLKADVYTFGMVLWQMFSLEMPFSYIYQRDDLVEFVINQGGRPVINENWPEPVVEVLRSSFDADMENRPSMQLFYNVLRFQLLALRDGDGTKLSDNFINRRRSFGSIRNLEANDDGRHRPPHEKFPQRVKNAIAERVKPPSPSFGGDARPPGRRRAARFREKFRLSVKHEE